MTAGDPGAEQPAQVLVMSGKAEYQNGTEKTLCLSGLVPSCFEKG